jgi:hypothetical protein
VKLLFYINILLCFSYTVFGQVQIDQISIESGPAHLTRDQPFTISVLVENSDERPVVIFPDLPHLQKRSMSVTSTKNTVGGKTVLVQTIIQEYYATKSGQIDIEAFTVKVADHNFQLEGKVLMVDLPQDDEELIGTEEIQDVEIDETGSDDIFLSLSINKRNVFVREGFSVRLSLFVAKTTAVSMEFYRLNEQLQSMLKELRPPGCWEENLDIMEIVQRETTVNGRQFSEYRMYEAVFFPLSLKDVRFPALHLKMLANNADGENLKQFSSKPVTVRVKPLPPHPARDQVSVGQFSLEEDISQETLVAGESFKYTLKIQGTGNISAIQQPVFMLSSFDLYPPDIRQVIKRGRGRVTGEKTFDYTVVARQNGIFPLNNFFNWIYFNPVKETYDTLSSERVIQVLGEKSRKIPAGAGEFNVYSDLENRSSSSFYLDYRYLARWVINIAAIAMFIAMIWVFIRK